MIYLVNVSALIPISYNVPLCRSVVVITVTVDPDFLCLDPRVSDHFRPRGLVSESVCLYVDNGLVVGSYPSHTSNLWGSRERRTRGPRISQEGQPVWVVHLTPFPTHSWLIRRSWVYSCVFCHRRLIVRYNRDLWKIESPKTKETPFPNLKRNELTEKDGLAWRERS